MQEARAIKDSGIHGRVPETRGISITHDTQNLVGQGPQQLDRTDPDLSNGFAVG